MTSTAGVRGETRWNYKPRRYEGSEAALSDKPQLQSFLTLQIETSWHFDKNANWRFVLPLSGKLFSSRCFLRPLRYRSSPKQVMLKILTFGLHAFPVLKEQLRWKGREAVFSVAWESGGQRWVSALPLTRKLGNPFPSSWQFPHLQTGVGIGQTLLTFFQFLFANLSPSFTNKLLHSHWHIIS